MTANITAAIATSPIYLVSLNASKNSKNYLPSSEGFEIWAEGLDWVDEPEQDSQLKLFEDEV